MSGEVLDSPLEHLSDVFSRYLNNTDLDYFTSEEIASTIASLENFVAEQNNNDDLYIILGLMGQIISHLYVARGYATSDIPRPLEYYQSMNAAKQLIWQMNLR
jgi:hypothetical protein